MARPIKILIVEDNPADAELLLRRLRQAGFEPDWQRVDSERAYLTALEDRVEIVLSDFEMPQFSGLRALELLREKGLEIPFVIISGTIGEETAVAAMKLGATDYLLKDRLARLGSVVNQALEQAVLRQERKQADAALLESERRYRLMFESNPQPMWVFDLETLQFLAVNDAAVSHYGYTRDEFLAMTIEDIRPPEEIPFLKAGVSQRTPTWNSERIWLHRKKDGTLIHVEITAHSIPFGDHDGRWIMATDVTARQRAQAELRASEERLRIVTDNAHVGLVMVNAERRYTFANATYAEMLGLASPEIVGQRVPDVLASLYEEQVRPRLDRAFAGERVAYELRRPTPEAIRHYAVRYEPTTAGGAVPLVVVVITDITERKQAENALRESEHRFRDMLENLGLISMTLDRQGAVTFCNDYLLRLTGWSRAEVLGGDWFERFLPAEASQVRAIFFAAFQRGAIPRHHENPIKTRGGELREITWNNTLLRDPNGEIIGTASIGEDVTDRKRAERKIHEQLEELLRWQDVMLNREDRVQALKAEVNELLGQQQKPTRYPDSPLP